MISNKAYNSFRSVLPPKVRRGMTKIVFHLSNKPRYYNDDYKGLEKPIVCISADFELIWAWRFAKNVANPLEIARRERANFPRILNILNDLQIPITWAIVGHLFLDKCEKKSGIPHAHMPRPKYFENEYWSFKKGDWYDGDPCSNYRKNPEFYAPDLIELIMNSKCQHELACHSFSHCDFDNINGDPLLIDAELAECKQAMLRFGITPVSFVFPGNRYGNFDLLKKHGFKIIRYKTEELKEIGFAERLKNDLIAIHDSIAIDLDDDGWNHSYILWKIKKYIERAIEKNAICHLWFHPSIPVEQMNNIFIPLLHHIAQLRDRGVINIQTMQTIGET